MYQTIQLQNITETQNTALLSKSFFESLIILSSLSKREGQSTKIFSRCQEI